MPEHLDFLGLYSEKILTFPEYHTKKTGMNRYLAPAILKDLKRKIILLSGPRQVGKTTLSKMLVSDFDYLNFDNPENRLALLERSWDRSKELIVFDELHKLQKWKSWLKGIYDTESIPPALMVTGSARLDTYRKAGDSLAGRFFPFRLHPLDIKEIIQFDFAINQNSDQILERLLLTGGFPEPFLENNLRFYKRWKRTHLDIIIRQDLLDLENIRQITALETLIQLLRKRVGTPISYRSLAEDLQCSDKTIKHWLTVLENMYVIFKVRPYHHNIARSLLKAPKYYFYDIGQVLGDNEIKLENLTACALLKEVHRQQDCFGEELDLSYIRDREKREIDFLITREQIPEMAVEVKWADDSPNRNFSLLKKHFSGIKKIQLIKELTREKTYPDGLELRRAASWLAKLQL